ncbi:hypothetical protein LDENG_00241140 [Lucifuga dentata]|nr:hypothetical protein LDENG_00241140 [Lucifuga dentata]
MSLRSLGKSCAVRGCTYNCTKLNLWLGQECFQHRMLSRRDCSCLKWYNFHRLPTEDEAKQMWLKNLNLKQPPKELYCMFVCFILWKRRPHRKTRTLLCG